MGISWRDGDAVGLASTGDAHSGDGGIWRVSRDGEMEGKILDTHGASRALTFSAFFAASASERLSKLTKPTGCGGRRGTISEADGEQRRNPSPQRPVVHGMGCSPHFVWLLPAWR